MILVGSAAQANAVHRAGLMPDGNPASSIHIISRAPDVKPSDPFVSPDPHAFIVRQPPASVLAPHFHFNRQFQVVLRGSGMLGRHQLLPGTVHYASAETAYGPITAGPDGLWYITLRQVTEVGAQYLPVAMDRLRRGLKRRQFTGAVCPLFAPGETSATSLLLADAATGLAAWMIDLPPGEAAPSPDDATPSDRYYVVVHGALRFGAETLTDLSAIWADRGESWPLLQAGNAGVRLVVVQFPHTA